MKVAFCVISNNSVSMEKFYETFIHHALVPGAENILCISTQQPFYDEKFRKLPNVRIKKRTGQWKGKFGKARMHSFQMATDADYLIMCDDDFRFRDGKSTHHFQWSAGERYLDAIEYLKNQKSCSAVFMKGYLGGLPSGRWILPMCSGFYETGLGIVIPGKSRPYKHIIDPQFLVTGAGEDTAIAITGIMQGYYPAKALNTAATKKPTKKMLIKEGKSSKNKAPANLKTNQLDFVNKHGVFSFISKKYGSFELGKRLPQTIIDAYRENATKLGHIIMF